MKMPWSGQKRIIKDSDKRQKITHLLFARVKMQWWILGIAFFLAIAWLIFPVDYRRSLLNPDDFKLGEKSIRDVFAQVDFEYRNEVDIEAEKQNALADVHPVFKLDFGKLENAKEEFKIARQVRAIKDMNDTEKVKEMKRLFYIGPSDAVGLILANASDEQIDLMEKGVLSIISDILSAGVVSNEERGGFAEELSKLDYLKPKWEKLKEKIETDFEIASTINVVLMDTRSTPPVERIVLAGKIPPLTEAAKNARNMAQKLPEPISIVVEEICVDLIRPNLIYDPVLTQERLNEVAGEFRPVNQKIAKGDRIIAIGDVITKNHKEKIAAMFSVQGWTIVRAIPGVIIIIGLITLATIMYLRRHEAAIFSEPRKIISLATAILLVLIFGYFLTNWGEDLKIYRPGFLIPTALAPIIVAILVNSQLAIFVTFVVGILIVVMSGVNTPVSLNYFIVILAGGITAALYIKQARHRRHLILAGGYVAGANVLTILGLSLLQKVSLVELGMGSLIGALNGAAVLVLSPGLLSLFEYLSGTTTDMKLLELSDLNQPLLNELKEKASGSYYHSIDVAKLAEAAADAIGANTLLVRVSSYYHDLGKMNLPEYFIENQKGENIHDNLNPNMSARVIGAHVKDGITIAKQHKLPKTVIDIIQQHAGTTLIGGWHFYQKALEADKHNTVRIEDFRYPGPKPQTKEAAIVLLADSVESAARVTFRDNNPSYSRLVGFVREIIEGKIMDFQLDESNLTLRDINLIADAFVRVLAGMYHARLEYVKENREVVSAVSKISKKENHDDDENR